MIQENNIRGGYVVQGSGGEPLGSAGVRRRVHGHDRKPAIRLDIICHAARSKISLGPAGDTGGLYNLRARRNLARAVRGLPYRSHWSETYGRGRRRPGRVRVAHQFAGGFALPALCGGCRRRRWSRHYLQRGDRERFEMVSRPARFGVRPYIGGGWRRLPQYRGAHFQYDTFERLRIDLSLLWYRSRPYNNASSTFPAISSDARSARRPANGACRPPRLSTPSGAPRASLLAAVFDIYPGLEWRTNVDSATGADRTRFPYRRSFRLASGSNTPGFDICSHARPNAQWNYKTVLWLDI